MRFITSQIEVEASILQERVEAIEPRVRRFFDPHERAIEIADVASMRREDLDWNDILDRLQHALVGRLCRHLRQSPGISKEDALTLIEAFVVDNIHGHDEDIGTLAMMAWSLGDDWDSDRVVAEWMAEDHAKLDEFVPPEDIDYRDAERQINEEIERDRVALKSKEKRLRSVLEQRYFKARSEAEKASQGSEDVLDSNGNTEGGTNEPSGMEADTEGDGSEASAADHGGSAPVERGSDVAERKGGEQRVERQRVCALANLQGGWNRECERSGIRLSETLSLDL